MKQQSSSHLTSNRGTASGSHQPLCRPGDGRAMDDALHNVDLEARGEFVEDRQRDRDSKGVDNGYDDSLQRRKGEGHDYLGIARGD